MRQILSDIRYLRFNSAIGRKLLGLVYKENRVYTIPFGTLRGFKVVFHPNMNYHAILGFWEPEITESVLKVLRQMQAMNPKRELIVADVGANLGMFTLVVARWLNSRNQGKVVAFEPAPNVVKTLRTNVELNHLRNVTVEGQACSNQVGSITFYIGADHHKNSLNETWAKSEDGHATAVTVPSTTLDTYFAEHGHFPDLIKMDIEGGAVYALQGAVQCAEKRPVVYIESHNPEEDRAISNYAIAHQFAAYHLGEHRWVTQPDQIHPHPEGIWGNLFLIPKEQLAHYQQVLS